jgi:hypothetical protein
MGVSAPWTPAAVPDCMLYVGAYQEARATRANAPVIADLSMDAADAAAWTASNATLAKSAVAPAQGTRWLEVTASAAYGSAYQNTVLVIGNRYAATGYGKGDGGTGTTKVGFGSGTLLPWSTASAAWQSCTAEGTAAGTTAFYMLAPKAGGSIVGFDGMAVANLSLQSYTPAYTTIPGSVLAQATATAQPWAGALGMMFDGDLMPWNAAASNVKCGHDGTGGTFGFAYRPTTLNAENRIIATAATAVGNVGVTVSCTNANTIRVRVMNGGGAYDYDSGDVACPIAINTTYAMVLRVASGAGGVSLRVNGTEVISGALTAPSAANPTTGLMLGGDAVGAAQNITGYIGQVWVVQRAITVAECAQYESTVAAGGL